MFCLCGLHGKTRSPEQASNVRNMYEIIFFIFLPFSCLKNQNLMCSRSHEVYSWLRYLQSLPSLRQKLSPGSQCGVSVFVHRLVFFAVHDHVIIIRTAPDDGCSSFLSLISTFAGDLRTALPVPPVRVTSIRKFRLQFQIFQLFSLRFLVVGSFSHLWKHLLFLQSPCRRSLLFLSVSSVCFFHITCLYRIFDADFMVIPFTFFSQKCHIKFLINGRYRDIKPVTSSV